jgi:hypothetical protein
VLDIEEGRFTYVDGVGHEVPTTSHLRTRHVIHPGRLLLAAHDDCF